MKQIGYVLLGLGIIILCIPFYIGFLYLISLTIGIGRAPGKQHWVVFIIILHVCFITGSFVSGYLIQPHMKQRSFFRYLLISPGVYLSLVGLVPALVYLAQLLYQPQPSDFQPKGCLTAIILFGYLELIAASFIGTRIGVFLRDRRIKQSNNRLHRIADKPGSR
jgi:hypothetical protein